MIMGIDFGNPIKVDYIRIFDCFFSTKKGLPKTLVFGNRINHLISLL